MAIKNTHTENAITIDNEILVGTWLRGEHLEDLDRIEASDIKGYGPIVAALKAGRTLLEIIKLYPDKAKALAELSSYRSDVLYRQALAFLIEAKVKANLSSMKLADVYEQLNFVAGIAEETPAPADFSRESFLTELKRRRDAVTVKYEGIPTLTNMTGGIQRKALITIAARPGEGKSTLALQFAAGAYKQGERVAYFPLEMTTTETVERLMARGCYATAAELRSGKVADTPLLDKGLFNVKNMLYSGFDVYEGCGTIEAIRAIIKKTKPGVVVIDQLSQLHSSTQTYRDIRTQYVAMTKELKRLAMSEDVAIILCAQLNRVATQEAPTLAHLKESGSIEEDSDLVILIHRLQAGDLVDPAAVDWTTQRPMILDVAKNRAGQTGSIQALMTPAEYKFRELTTRY